MSFCSLILFDSLTMFGDVKDETFMILADRFNVFICDYIPNVDYQSATNGAFQFLNIV